MQPHLHLPPPPDFNQAFLHLLSGFVKWQSLISQNLGSLSPVITQLFPANSCLCTPLIINLCPGTMSLFPGVSLPSPGPRVPSPPGLTRRPRVYHPVHTGLNVKCLPLIITLSPVICAPTPHRPPHPHATAPSLPPSWGLTSLLAADNYPLPRDSFLSLTVLQTCLSNNKRRWQERWQKCRGLPLTQSADKIKRWRLQKLMKCQFHGTASLVMTSRVKEWRLVHCNIRDLDIEKERQRTNADDQTRRKKEWTKDKTVSNRNLPYPQKKKKSTCTTSLSPAIRVCFVR